MNTKLLSFLFALSLLSLIISSNLYSDCNRGRTPENGEWVSYYIYSNKEKMELKLAITGEENVQGKKALWFETIIRSQELEFIIKRLVTGDPLKPDKVLRQIVKIINKKRPDYAPALELPAESSDKAEDTLKSFPCIDKEGEKITYKFGKKSLNAFTFKSDKPKSMIIFSKEIPFFGVIRAESDNTRIELTDYGRNASTEITEEPIKLMNNKEEK
ncbi:MAG: hypothetical protein N3B13_01455 [Deltaproteobacteria bacterium]|nr:hypothetical protein [Deltaproteobacteria bacterium]